MKRIFISQDMRNESKESIIKVRELIKSEFRELFGGADVFIDSYKPELKHATPIYALSESIGMLAQADFLLAPKNRYESVKDLTVAYCNEHTLIRGVETEINIALTYGVPVIFYSVNEKRDSVRFEFNIKS